MSDNTLQVLQNIIIPAAKQELLPRFTRVRRNRKADGSVCTEADLAMQQRLSGELQTRWPDTVFLGEEMAPAMQQKLLASGKAVWCLDPLDGTGNFAAGIPFFSVSLALLENGRISAGIVYDPVRDECFSAALGEPACLNGQVLHTKPCELPLGQSTALVDFKRLPAQLAKRLAVHPPYASQRSFGSVALDWCWIAAGRCHVYLHGKQHIWDYAAGHLILQQAGGYSCTLSGESVFINALQTRSAVAALDKHLFDQWRACLDCCSD